GGPAFGADEVGRRHLHGDRQLAEDELQQGRDVQFLGRVRGQLLLPGTRLAQVHLPLLLVDDVRQVDGGRVRAELAFHTDHPRPATKGHRRAPGQPSSSCLIRSRSRAASSYASATTAFCRSLRNRVNSWTRTFWVGRRGVLPACRVEL